MAFDSQITESVGTTPAPIYSVTDGKNAVVIGIAVSCKKRGEKGIDCYIQRGDTRGYIKKGHRVPSTGGTDLLEGSKLVLKDGDVLYAQAPEDDAFDVIVSTLPGQ